MIIDPNLRHRIHDLYAAYAACLDDARYAEWPEFFTDDAWYRVVPRENYDRAVDFAIDNASPTLSPPAPGKVSSRPDTLSPKKKVTKKKAKAKAKGG